MYVRTTKYFHEPVSLPVPDQRDSETTETNWRGSPRRAWWLLPRSVVGSSKLRVTSHWAEIAIVADRGVPVTQGPQSRRQPRRGEKEPSRGMVAAIRQRSMHTFVRSAALNVAFLGFVAGWSDVSSRAMIEDRAVNRNRSNGTFGTSQANFETRPDFHHGAPLVKF